jgi:hypothetical protein
MLGLVVAVLAGFAFPIPSQGFSQETKSTRSDAELKELELLNVNKLIESATAKESAGEYADRDRLLNEAAAIAGTRHSKLNAIRGLVFEYGQWLTPDEVVAQSSREGWLKKYQKIRKKSADNFLGNYELAEWCQQSGLINEARAHLLRALDFDIDCVDIREMLGHVNIGGRWVTPEQIQSLNDEANAVLQLLEKHADESQKILRMLESQSKKKRDEGLARLRQINDPEWTFTLEFVFAPLTEEIGQVAVDRLSSFHERESTQALMRIAIYSPWPTIREAAATGLQTRDQFDYVPDLISMLATPVTSQYSIQRDRLGGVLYQHLFSQQTDEKDIVRLTGVAGSQSLGGNPFVRRPINASEELRAAVRFQRAALIRAQQMESMKETFNRSVEEQNLAVIAVLSQALNMDFGNDATAWWNWWNDQNEFSVFSRPLSYQSTLDHKYRIGDRGSVTLNGRKISCLVAGTKIWTLTGLVPVEQITVGDRVLARDMATGNLSYRPVLRPTVRPATSTIEIKLEGDVIQASGGHRFWILDKGWVKARDLTPGMRLLTVRGSTPVVSIEPAEEVELFNLVVEQDSNYFVSQSGVLSHDNTIPSEGAKTLWNRASQ